MKRSRAAQDRSLAGVVRERLPDLEQRIRQGWRLAALHRELVAQGHVQEFEAFRSALRRARRQVADVAQPAVETSAQIPRQPASPPATPSSRGIEPVDYFARQSVFGRR